MYILKKSYKSWSAGTRVDIMSPLDTMVVVRTRSPQKDGRNAQFEVPMEYLEERRDRYVGERNQERNLPEDSGSK